MYLTARTFTPLCLALLISAAAFAQPTNDNCSASLPSLTPQLSCSTTTGSLYNATTGGPSNSCGTAYDVWYTFTVPANAASISINVSSTAPTNLTSSNTSFQVYSGTGCSLTPIGSCTALGTTLTTTSLTPGATYDIRVFTSTSPSTGNANKWDFSICVTYGTPPANDDCPGAITLASGVTNSSGTVWLATASSGIPLGCASGTPDDDVWYKFTTPAQATGVTVNLSSVGSDLNTSGARLQMFSGSCGSLSSYACGTSTLSASVSGNTTYYIRVYSAGTGAPGSTASGSAFSITETATVPTTVTAGRMNEVFQQTILSDANVLNYPWEITYGPDAMLWITESRGYKVYRMDPVTGAKTTVLDLSQGSTFLPSPSDSLDVQFSSTQNPWPQGGLAGLALHPNFLDGTGLNDFVYVSYVHRYLGGSSPSGRFFRNKLVRFSYNQGTGKLESPVVLCDTLPGSNDHNSQRIIIAPVVKGGTNYLFYAQGDMGAGQFDNRLRTNNAQNPASYEGKILRFNLVTDGDAGAAAWIPNDNPYNTLLGVQSAVYSIGIRNNQGFAYDTTLNILYGSSHGPYSDDEINVIEAFRNYGHPLIEGFVDGNYNGNSAQGTSTSVSAGAPYTDNGGISACPPIGNEAANKTAIDASGNGLYKDPLFSAYAASQATVTNIWQTNPGNALPAPGWPTEAWSGLDLYSNKLIPGWKKSLVAASLKWGRLVRLRMNAAGTGTAPANAVSDTISYFGSQNRFRDLAFSTSGKDIFVIMDNTSTTSGPGAANPVVPTCAGCVQKYTFLGYNSDANGKSMIPSSIDVAAGTAGACQAGTTVTIDNTNNTLWVPITGQDGNILAEIKANGNALGTITSSFYTNGGPVRENSSKKLYSDRNITITPQNQPTSAVSVRIYMTAAEFTALKNATNSVGSPSGVTAISDIALLKNQDACGNAMINAVTTITPQYAEAFGNNYVVQGDITSFSTFYLGSVNTVILPLQLLTFTGSLQTNRSALLQWQTDNEDGVAYFMLERSTDATRFTGISTLTARGGLHSRADYSYTDNEAGTQPAGTLYYRLKMVNTDGRYAYSQVISLVRNQNLTVSLYPNPVKQVLTVRLTGAGANTVMIQITDLTGRSVYTDKRTLNGAGSINIDVRSWKPQVYFLKVLNAKNEMVANQKFEKM